METQSMHPEEVTRGLQVNPVGDLKKNAQSFMVIIWAIWGSLMTYRAITVISTLGISVKGLCHVQKMKKVGACELYNKFQKTVRY